MKNKIARRDFINGVSAATAGTVVIDPRALWAKGANDLGPDPIGADCSDAASSMNGESFRFGQGQVNAKMSSGYVPVAGTEG